MAVGETWKVRQDGADWTLTVVEAETMPCGCVTEKIEHTRPECATWWSRRLLPDPIVHRKEHLKR